MLTNHRRAFAWSLVLLGACVVTLFSVGRQPPGAGPETSVAFVGHLDASVWRWMGDIRVGPLTAFFHLLNIVGGGLVTIPLRASGAIILALRRRWRAFAAFVLTWATSEIALRILKSSFDRGRPSGSLVETSGSSFPSGHAVAGAATAVAIVLAFLPEGARRRRWEWAAVIFSFVMAFSRVYLRAHWLSDVLAGTLLGAGIAIFWFATFTELRDIWRSRKGLPPQREMGDPIVADG
jgi:membrane-associated phospholipid phosphatase